MEIDLSCKKTLTIITEGGKSFGFGHITRCISIANQFKKNNFHVQFIINGDESLHNILKDESFVIFDWSLEQTKLLQMLNSSLVLIDSIEIADPQIQDIENSKIPIIFIDDESRRNVLNRGFVIDWTVLSEKQNYFTPKKEDVIYLLGSKFTPLRENFTTASLNPIRKTVQKILISFGGSDVRNLTPQVLQNLNNHFPDIIKNVIIGNGFTNVQEIQALQTQNVNLIFSPTEVEIIALMHSCDIAISAGGQTLYELARIGVPSIATILVQNAKDDTLGWEKVGSLLNIGWWDDKEFQSKLLNAINTLQDYSLRKDMQFKAQEYSNPNGAKYLVDNILEKL